MTETGQPLRIGLFGAGSRGVQCLIALRDDPRFAIECFFDNDPSKWGLDLEGIPIRQPTAANCAGVETIVLASLYAREILVQLSGLGCKRVVSSPAALVRRASNEDDYDANVAADPAAMAQMRDRLLAAGPPAIAAIADRLDDEPAAMPARSEAWTDATACTICCNNYLAHAIVLGRSFLRHHPGGRFFIGLADRHAPDVRYPDDPRIRVIAASELDIREFDAVAFKYDVVEFNTAIKPYLLSYLFRHEGVRRLLYLDPDILVLEPLSALFERLATVPMLLTPHLTRPYDDDRLPQEVDIMRAGTFNLGFIGLAAHAQTDAFLAWWQQRLYDGCARDTSKGYFTDQKWIDFVPSFFPEHAIVREPGYNVAYWNLHEQTITAHGAQFRSNGQPLKFYHFSGFDIEDLDAISKHQNRHTLPATGALRSLFELYRVLLLRHGHLTLRAIPYGYERFDNGTRIPGIIRTIFRESHLTQTFPNPFRTTGPRSFFDWLRAPGRRGTRISNLLATLHARQVELRATFPDPYGAGQAGFLLYMSAAADLYGLPPALTDAIADQPQGERTAGAAWPGIAAPHRLHDATADVDRGVNVIGYLRSETGMGEGGRTLIRALQRKQYPVTQTVLKNRDGARQRDDSLRNVPTGAPHPVSVVFANADQADVVYDELGPAFFAGRYNIAVWLWELDTLPASMHRFEFYDEIWTNSEFVRRAVAAVSPVPVTNVRMPIAAPPPPPVSMRAQLGLPDGRKIFLFAFDSLSIVARKNPLAVVEAFRRAFGERSDEAFLVVKASRLEAFPDDHRALADALQSVGGRLFDRYFDRPTLNGLFHACDAYVSLHRSEGFGLTMAEAMAMGKPVIATGYSGNADFMTADNSYPVRFRLTPLDRFHGPYPSGAVWAEPDLDHAAELMRAIVDHPDAAAARGARAAADISRTHGIDVVGGLLTSRLDAIYAGQLCAAARPGAGPR